MNSALFEKAFLNVKKFITVKDRRREMRKWKTGLAKQEFSAEVKEEAEKWFDKRVRTLKPQIAYQSIDPASSRRPMSRRP